MSTLPVPCVCVLLISEMSVDSVGFTSKGTPGMTPSEGFKQDWQWGTTATLSQDLFILPGPDTERGSASTYKPH